ncbi:hypothetical protein C8J56DRAFT_794447 [Mycena floridula]|nr:hypothetical protein C8J56DRAFT_794447 [Mycena floridula]
MSDPKYPQHQAPAYDTQYSQQQVPMQPINNLQPPQAPQMPKSASQIGEEYRAQLFARCAQGACMSLTTKYGVCGIITAVVCFPIGLICLFMDTEQKCARCGIRLDK